MSFLRFPEALSEANRARRTSPLRIVIVGGGFGGLYAASYLSRSELTERGAIITLIDRKNFFTFTPLLAEVAAGTLGQEHVTSPYRALGRRWGFDFIQDEVQGLDPEARLLRTSRGVHEYDYLVLATGAESTYFGNRNVERRSLPLTTVGDAVAIRNKVVENLEHAMVTEGTTRDRLLTMVVAGAGPAGVEIASEIDTLANRTLRPYYPDLSKTRVILVTAGTRILEGWDEKLACEGQELLRGRGLEVRLGTRIEDVTPEGIVATCDGMAETIASDTLIWTAGTAPPAWLSEAGLELERGAVRVNGNLQADGYERVFAVGDMCALSDERTGRRYPAVAPIAISQGVKAAANIESHALGRTLEPYRAHHAGNIVSLGSGDALVDLLGFRLTGRLAWWMYRGAYVLKLIGMKNKVRVLVTLAINHIFEPDISAMTSWPGSTSHHTATTER